MVSTFQKPSFRRKTRKKTKNMRTAKKLEDVELQALLDSDDSQTQKQLAKHLDDMSTICFQLPTRDGTDSEDW